MVGGVVQQRAHEIRLGGSTIQSFPSIAATRHLPGKARGAPSVSPRAPSTAVPLIARTAGSARRLQTRALPAAAAAAAASLTTATAAAAAAPNMTQLMFTPATCLLGGLTLGVAAVGKFAITGRILGISGALKGFVQGRVTPWRVWFSAGMVAGGLVAGAVTPGAFDALPATFTVTRAAVGGLLVGLGASMGNGCTSGHGICGNARLSVRSLVYTAVFMAAGMAAATLTDSAAALGIAAAKPPLVWPGGDVTSAGALLLATSVLTMLGLARAAQQVAEPKSVELATELASGALFAFGLTLTGMVRPAKVVGFLSPLSPAWDLSLMFVMGGALLVALPGFQAILRSKSLKKPFACATWELPVVNSIDPRLVLGGLLFGSGWGITGACPGPAIVALVAKPVPQIVAYCVSMLVGMWVQPVVAPDAAPKPATC